MADDYEFTEPDMPDEDWDDSDEVVLAPMASSAPVVPGNRFRWAYDGGDRFAACRAADHSHQDLLARHFGVDVSPRDFATGVFVVDDNRVELTIYDGPGVARELLEKHIATYLRGNAHARSSPYSKHLRSFVWADGELELERSGERAAHAELERRLRARLREPLVGPVTSGEVWQRRQRTRASHTGATDSDALRSALEAALHGLRIELEDIGDQG